MIQRRDTYSEIYETFRWPIPARYNMGVDVCDQHAGDPKKLALIIEDEHGAVRRYTFAELRGLSNRLCNVLQAQGLVAGDRIAVLLPQSLETALAHIAGWKSGLITLPLFTLFGPDALEYRLQDSGAAAIVTDAAGCERLAPLRDRLPQLKHVLCIDGAPAGALGYAAPVRVGRVHAPVDTARRSCDHRLYVGHHRQSEGRAPRAARAAGALAGHRTAARFLSAAR